MKIVLSLLLLVLNFYGWYGIFTVGASIFGGTPLGAAKFNQQTTTVQKSESPAKQTFAAVTADALNMREGPGADNALVMTLHKGNVLTILEKSEETRWLKVEYDGKSGYVHGDYITETNN